MPSYYEQVKQAASYISSRSGFHPDIALIFGTGLSEIGEKIEVEAVFPYEDLPFFASTTVKSHGGQLLVGLFRGVPVFGLQGRYHLYEGYSPKEVTFPIRVLAQLGVTTLLASNAAGGINPHYTRGDLVLVTDHINLQGVNPLEGANLEKWGPRFPDMTEPYDEELRRVISDVAMDEGILLQKGVYASVVGPNLETRAEYRYLGNLGADLVGMSTVPEVIVARHMNMTVSVLSVVTDECQPGALEPIDVADVFAALKAVRPDILRILSGTVERVGAALSS